MDVSPSVQVTALRDANADSFVLAFEGPDLRSLGFGCMRALLATGLVERSARITKSWYSREMKRMRRMRLKGRVCVLQKT